MARDHAVITAQLPTDNDILLRAGLHLLFDSSLIAVEPASYEVVTSARLSGTEYAELGGRRLRVPRRSELTPNPDYLAAHYHKFRHLEGVS